MGVLVVIVVGAAVAAACVFAPAYLPRSRDPAVTEVMRVAVMMTLVCCYMAWAFAYMAQLNPIFPPVLRSGGH